MQSARMLGSYVWQLAESKGLSVSDLSKILGCSDLQAWRFIKGRAVASIAQIFRLAAELHASVEDLLAGDPEHYEATVVCCEGEFCHPGNREFILDLMYDYMDVVEAVAQ